MIRALVLDWAGTVADDQALTLAATNATLERLGGEPVDMETYRRDFVVPVMGFYGPRLPGRTLDEVDGVFFEEYRARLADVTLFDGAIELLHLARARGVPVSILSTLRADDIDQALRARGIRDLVGAVHGNAADKREVLPDLVARSGVPADETLFVGDSPNDVAAAHVARVRAGAALYGYTPVDRLRAAGADYEFDSPADVVRKLDREHLLDGQRVVVATVGGLILDPDDRVLLVKTRKWSGTWGIPGGKIDYGETMEAAYEREIREETGLELSESRFIMIQDCIESTEFVHRRHFLLVNYLSRTARPEALQVNYEIEDTVWAGLDELDAFELNEPTRVLFEEVERLGILKPGEGA